MKLIDEIRSKYDPLANHVRPHITLAFPFDSIIQTSELEEHLKSAISETKPFEIRLQGVTPSDLFGRYLFLNVSIGLKEICDLHCKVYSGILESQYPVWLNRNDYLPHMTIGNFSTEGDYQTAINETKHFNESFDTIVRKVSVEIIDENEDSIIEIEVPLIG
jgi:2'-5' RNA ligase